VDLKTDRVMVWKFDDAPDEVRILHRAAEPTSWAALIPRQIHAADLDEEIHSRWGAAWVSRYETTDGDIVYCGSCAMTQFLEVMAAGFPNSGKFSKSPAIRRPSK
jgi:hypothetical protein